MRRLLIGLVAAAGVVLALGAAVASAQGPEGGWHRGAGWRERLAIVAEMLEMRPREMLQALRDGETVATLAAEQGVALDDIEAALMEPRRERLDVLLSDRTLSAEQVAYLNAEADEVLNRFLTLPIRRAVVAEPLADLATVLGVSEDEIVAAVESGGSRWRHLLRRGGRRLRRRRRRW